MALFSIDELNEFNKKVRESDRTVVIDFWATWCNPCRAFKPIFESTSQLYKDVDFITVDIDDGIDIASSYNIMSVPTVMIIKNNKTIASTSGGLSLEKFKEFIDKNI